MAELTACHRMAAVPLLQKSRLSGPNNVHSVVPRLHEDTSSGTNSLLSLRPTAFTSMGKVDKATREKRHSSRYMGLVTWTTIDTSVEDGHGKDSEMMPNRKGNITLRLPFSSVRFDFYYSQSMGSPSYALNINHVIDRWSELELELQDIMFKQNLVGLKRLLSDRKLSIYSCISDSNLFYVSGCSEDIIPYLLVVWHG